MFKLIISFFRGLRSLVRGTNKLAQETTKALESSAEEFRNTVDEINESSAASKARAVEKYKKEKAQLVIDGSYESEEAMYNAVNELIGSIKKRRK